MTAWRRPATLAWVANDARSDVHRHLGRYLTADVASHPVGDREEVGTLERLILVGAPDPTDIGGGARTQYRHLVTSKTVAPTCRRSPLASLEGLAIRSELTYVPLVDLRSSTHSWSPRR